MAETDFQKTPEYKYFLFTDFIFKLRDNTSLLYSFEDNNNFRTLTVYKADKFCDTYTIEFNDVVYFNNRSKFDPSLAYTYNEVIRMPVFYCENINKKIPLALSVDDGRYFGRVLGINGDGTRLFVLLGRMIKMEPAQIAVIKKGQSLEEVLGVKEFYHYSHAIDTSVICVIDEPDTSAKKIWLFGEEAYIDYDDGYYLFFGDHQAITTDEFIATIDVAPDCEIIEQREPDTPDIAANNNLQKTDLYYYGVKKRLGTAMNLRQYFEVFVDIRNCIIKDNKIVKCEFLAAHED